MPITVGDQNLTGVVVPLRRAATLRGRIVWANGPPSTESGMGRMGMAIYAEPANGEVSLGMPMGANLPADPTRFRIEGLLAGSYTLRLLTRSGSVKSIEWAGRDYTDRPFDASSGSDIEDVVITLTTEVTRVTGTVRDGAGQAAASPVVIVFPTDRSRWTGYGFRPARILSAQLTTAGAFTINSLPAGEYFVVAVDESLADAWQDPRFLEAASGVASRFTVGWGETKTVDLAVSVVKVR